MSPGQAKEGDRLDRLYDNRNWVPDFPAHLQRWNRTSAAVLRERQPLRNLAYGPSDAERLDIFPAARHGAPVLFFIHGGFWRALDKDDYAFIAPAYMDSGVCVVMVNYALCPAVSLQDIVLQMVRALCWTYSHITDHGGDPARLLAAGHSAGGHLAAMLACCDWRAVDERLPATLARDVVSLSGLFDLQALKDTPSLQHSLQLNDVDVAKASPARLAPPRTSHLHTYVGDAESAEFIRQHRLLARRWGKGQLSSQVLPGLNHLSIVDAFAHRDSALHTSVQQLLWR